VFRNANPGIPLRLRHRRHYLLANAIESAKGMLNQLAPAIPDDFARWF